MSSLTLDPSRTAFLIQGAQRDLLDPAGAVTSEEVRAHARAQNLVPNIAALAEAVRAGGGAVIHGLLVVEKDGRGLKVNAPLFRLFRDKGAFRRGSWGFGAIDELAPRPEDYVVEKARENPFYNTMLETILLGLGIETIVLGGANTSGGVEHAARHAADAGYRVVIPRDAVAGPNEAAHSASLAGFLVNVAEIVDTRDVLAALR